MITDFLLKKTLKGNTDYNNKDVRIKVGYLASIVGLVINILLSTIKLSIGVLISSVSVIADGINNLSDTASSIITIVGFKLSAKPADKEHPYGHGRLEYISALMVAFMVILVGFQFIQTSYDRIINPLPVKFEVFSFVILVISIGSKIWLSAFNKNLGNKINSTGLKATAQDALGDVMTTSVVVLSIVISQFTSLPIDGIIGVIVSLLIMYNGYNLVKDTISPLIGEAPDEELIKNIYEDVMTYEHITGSHDLHIHTYGAGRTMATIDVEFPAKVDVVEIHDVIDQMEREIGEKYDLTLVVHMDPLGPESRERFLLRHDIKKIIKKNPLVKSMHDFNILEENEEETIEFHVVIDGNMLNKGDSDDSIKREMEEIIEEKCEGMKCSIIIDIDYQQGE